MWPNNDEIEPSSMIGNQWNRVVQVLPWPPNSRAIRIADSYHSTGFLKDIDLRLQQNVVQMQQWPPNSRVIRLTDSRIAARPVFEIHQPIFANGPWQHQGQATVAAASCGQQGAPQWSPAVATNTLQANHAASANMPPQAVWQWAPAQQTSNQPGTTYADHVKRPGGARLPPSSAPTHYESSQNWSTKVEQAWETNPRGVPAVNIDNKTDWNGGRNRWSGQWGPQGASGDWNPRPETVPWNGTRPLAPAPLIAGTVPAAPWPPNPQPMPPQVEQLEVNAQTPGTWVPQQSEMNNDMMWHDPNPKQKKVTRDNGTAIWGEPASQLGVEIRRWKDSDVLDFSHIQPATASGGDWENAAAAADPATSDNESMIDTEGVSTPDMLRKLLDKGLIQISQLNTNVTRQLQLLITRMYKKVVALEKLQLLQHASQKGQAERMAVDSQTLKTELSHLKDAWIEHHLKSTPQGMNGIVSSFPPSDGQSRLSQWKHGVERPDIGADKVNTVSDVSIQNLISGTNALVLEDKGDWRTGALEWSSNVAVSGRASEDVNDEKGQTIVAIAEKAANSLSHTPEESAVDDGPPEFVPGKKWAWRDPNKIAEDPNAKPGDVKPNPLLSSSSSGALPSGPKYISNEMPTTKLGGWGHHDVWNTNRITRPYIGQQSFQPRMPIGQQNYYRQQNPYILIYLNNPAEQEQILYRCTKLGQVSHYMSGGNVMYIRFTEPAEIVLPRLKAEIASKMKIISESEIERNIKIAQHNSMNSMNSIMPFNTNWGLINGEWPYGQLPTDVNPGMYYS